MIGYDAIASWSCEVLRTSHNGNPTFELATLGGVKLHRSPKFDALTSAPTGNGVPSVTHRMRLASRKTVGLPRK